MKRGCLREKTRSPLHSPYLPFPFALLWPTLLKGAEFVALLIKTKPSTEYDMDKDLLEAKRLQRRLHFALPLAPPPPPTLHTRGEISRHRQLTFATTLALSVQRASAHRSNAKAVLVDAPGPDAEPDPKATGASVPPPAPLGMNVLPHRTTSFTWTILGRNKQKKRAGGGGRERGGRKDKKTGGNV